MYLKYYGATTMKIMTLGQMTLTTTVKKFMLNVII
jgi:hypothetical protein